MANSQYHAVSPAVIRPSRFESDFSRPRHGTSCARHGMCEIVRNGTARARHGMCELASKVAFDIPFGKQTSAHFLPYTQLAAARFVVAMFTAGQTDTAWYCPQIIYRATLHYYFYIDRLGAAERCPGIDINRMCNVLRGGFVLLNSVLCHKGFGVLYLQHARYTRKCNFIYFHKQINK